MKISVVTVCRNSEQTIERTLQSVACQTCDDFEYIVIDGVSTDRTLEIIEKYKSHISKFVSEPDKGIYDAMNKGAKMAEGEYVVFLNADDVFIHENVLSLVVEKMKNKKADLYYGDLVFLEKNTGKINNRKQDNVNNIYLCGGMLFHPAIFASKKIFEKIGYFDTNYRIAADYDWILNVVAKNKVTCEYLGMPITMFSDGDGASSNEKNRQKHKNERDEIQHKYFSSLFINIANLWYKSFRSTLYMPIIKQLLRKNFLQGRKELL